MKFLAVIVSTLFLSMTMASCQPIHSSQEPVPTDEATPEERAIIEKTMTHLAKLFKENGYKGSFDKMPTL